MTKLKRDDDETLFTEYTADEAIAENIARIRRYHTDIDVYASTSQKIMIGLALCRHELLDSAGYPARDIKIAWQRLDDNQRSAIIAWWKD
ncbi:hypothetical protein [Paludibacterium paludis]|uniref:Uncharacterized protein n=1 Tax=Paludibacterium paludis TaxID=1225769 RepID=A0A918NXP6_9NEIS|nr:hypothetical protein [Paludibacterium paludis]GGY03617.1 hypothetical protein GCM10011289_02440 [Paludibacterium paludis]